MIDFFEKIQSIYMDLESLEDSWKYSFQRSQFEFFFVLEEMLLVDFFAGWFGLWKWGSLELRTWYFCATNYCVMVSLFIVVWPMNLGNEIFW